MNKHKEILVRYLTKEGSYFLNILGFKQLSNNDKIYFIKDVFNAYFRDHLYGEFRSQENVILSSGSVDHQIYTIPEALKYFISYALTKDWYGYSDCRGRLQSRRALSHYENTFFQHAPYTEDNVCITMGATSAVASIFDFIANSKNAKLNKNRFGICATPNYPPLVKSMSRHFDVELVELDYENDDVILDPIIDKLNSGIQVVFMQTVINPSGKKVSEKSLAKLINTASKNTIIILDECHECFGEKNFCTERTRSNVIRINSFSKEFLVPGIKIGWFVAEKLFVDEYYEYASSSYGSPASVFYLLIEGLAIFEMHNRKGISLDKKFFSEYDIPDYELEKLYENYLQQTKKNIELIISNREFTVQRLRKAGFVVIEPSHSLNVLFAPPVNKDSYSIFIELLLNTGVSVYPSILNFIFSRQYVRISPNVNRNLLEKSLEKIIDFYKTCEEN